ncbi:MAG TPA: GNAT family N-acetyltransferase [Phenylobacterium sp.]|jgi:ribosomal protein S18 acetylase RimI-like enzyme|nr:GNAT family N-acetyltransferase [Phenylobacterium sp.]
MRDALVRIDHFNPARSAARFEREFRPRITRLIECDGAFAGCVTVYPHGDSWIIEHFYLAPQFQRQGLGDAVMRRLLAEADEAEADVRLSVLVDSEANRFYPRYGFVETHREAFDIYYLRPAATPR